MKRKGLLLQPGIREYNEILKLQKRANKACRLGTIPDTVIFLEHYSCITIGAQGECGGIMVSAQRMSELGIGVYETNRGGKVTYHGPGQIVCYPIIDLRNYGCDVTTYARNLEEMVIRTIDGFGISSVRKPGYPGVWVEGKGKIAAEGISIDRWVTMHGIALNVSPVMDHFGLIVPCGLRGYGVTSMKECSGCVVSLQTVMSEMVRQFSVLFDLELEEISQAGIMELLDHAENQAA
jgi:lipoyl(octanoyl) transferase